MHTAMCQKPFVLLIYTGDNKFLCQGEHYEVFPALPDDVEVLDCPSQFFTEFPAGTFENKSHLLNIDISNGSLETLNKDTLKGAKSLQALNAAGCNIQGEIPEETFCDNTPDLRFLNLSLNPDYVFTSKPFECLKKLDALWIEGTIQNCDADTVKWINELSPDKVIVGDTCSSHSHSIPVCLPLGKFPAKETCVSALSNVLLFNNIWMPIKRHCLID